MSILGKSSQAMNKLYAVESGILLTVSFRLIGRSTVSARNVANPPFLERFMQNENQLFLAIRLSK
jgi:hypothetical protein